MKIPADHELVKKYKEQLELEANRELPVMSLGTWLHGFEYWSPYHAKELEKEHLDWSNK